MSADKRTVSEAIDDLLLADEWSSKKKLADLIADALGIDPATPLDRLHVLQDDETVVKGLTALNNGWWRIHHIVKGSPE